MKPTLPLVKPYSRLQPTRHGLIYEFFGLQVACVAAGNSASAMDIHSHELLWYLSDLMLSNAL